MTYQQRLLTVFNNSTQPSQLWLRLSDKHKFALMENPYQLQSFQMSGAQFKKYQNHTYYLLGKNGEFIPCMTYF